MSIPFFLEYCIALKPRDRQLQSYSSTMIYITTLFLTLFLTHIARALPRGCHDIISPETDTNHHDFTYGDTQVTLIPSPLKATFDQTFDNPSGSLNNVACSNGQNGLASKQRFDQHARL